MYREFNRKDCNSKELESSQVGVLLENFWCKAIFRIRFTLLLFLHGLMSSVLSSINRLFFVERKPLLKKHVLITCPNCSCAFLERTFCCNGDWRPLVKKNRIGIYCALQTFFAGKPLGVRRS